MKTLRRRGRPPKLKRNMEICMLIDKERMTRKEIMEHYRVSPSRLTNIIKENWTAYIKNKKVGKE